MARLNEPAPVRLGALSPFDLPAAAKLSAAVGWNQDEADWQRLRTVQPDGMFAAYGGSRLVGTATLVRYGSELAWLGMVIVDAEYRGSGLGTALVDMALAAAPPGVPVGLDATGFGSPLYRRKGFVTVGSVQRWAGVIRIADEVDGDLAAPVREARSGDAGVLASFDRSASGVDRRRLLSVLLEEPGATVLVVERGADVAAYAVVRGGRERRHVGPVVALDRSALTSVMRGVARLVGHDPVFVDVATALSSDEATPLDDAADWPGGFGLERVRTLERMLLPGGDGASEGMQTAPLTGAGWSREAASGTPGGAVRTVPTRALMGRFLAAATGLEWG